ncbi:hypothetical protein GYMLUDRAFT_63503 [Collybiopsis luxurians FD-317 M1]|uniref:Uncharacterized protein n=1 Tax=Collybiopsis luxurians FD-317 M1 TaxID=944289 RepID=A0A0D0BW06_9AGAR|nr:hypothetical protein GYMLUDRAFT_63503 [Collybiopsis luxurians FD-317 M1]
MSHMLENARNSKYDANDDPFEEIYQYIMDQLDSHNQGQDAELFEKKFREASEKAQCKTKILKQARKQLSVCQKRLQRSKDLLKIHIKELKSSEFSIHENHPSYQGISLMKDLSSSASVLAWHYFQKVTNSPTVHFYLPSFSTTAENPPILLSKALRALVNEDHKELTVFALCNRKRTSIEVRGPETYAYSPTVGVYVNVWRINDSEYMLKRLNGWIVSSKLINPHETENRKEFMRYLNKCLKSIPREPLLLTIPKVCASSKAYRVLVSYKGSKPILPNPPSLSVQTEISRNSSKSSYWTPLTEIAMEENFPSQTEVTQDAVCPSLPEPLAVMPQAPPEFTRTNANFQPLLQQSAIKVPQVIPPAVIIFPQPEINKSPIAIVPAKMSPKLTLSQPELGQSGLPVVLVNQPQTLPPASVNLGPVLSPPAVTMPQTLPVLAIPVQTPGVVNAPQTLPEGNPIPLPPNVCTTLLFLTVNNLSSQPGKTFL